MHILLIKDQSKLSLKMHLQYYLDEVSKSVHQVCCDHSLKPHRPIWLSFGRVCFLAQLFEEGESR